MSQNNRKRELDQKRTEWRKKHRTLNGRIILYPEKQPEHINARASKLYNWFWKKILLEIEPQDIPAIVTSIKDQIKTENDTKKIRVYRTMIGMAEDCYQLKRLDDITEYDSELMLDNEPNYNSEVGVIYKDGNIFTTDYDEDESKIFLRDIEGIIVDTLFSDDESEKTKNYKSRMTNYKDWKYTEEK